MKFFTAIKQSEFAAALLAAAGFNLEQLATAGNTNALKDHLASLKPTEEATSLTAKVKTLSDENATLKAALDSAQKEHDELFAALKAEMEQSVNASTLLNNALAASGVKLPVATADKPVDQAAIQGAIDARISTKAREQLAKHGINDPLPVDPAADASKPVGTSKSMSAAQFAALSPKEKMEFSRNGGRLTE